MEWKAMKPIMGHHGDDLAGRKLDPTAGCLQGSTVL
jgi:hypothetical protein